MSRLDESAFPPGALLPASEEEFDEFRNLCRNEEGWIKMQENRDTTTWFRKTASSQVHCAKVHIRAFETIPSNLLFDVLMDPEFSSQWDDHLAQFDTLYHIDRRNEVMLYCVKLPFPLAPREWILKLSTRISEDGSEYIIFSKSVEVPSLPRCKGRVRAKCILSGYMITKVSEKGCTLSCLAHNEWNGLIPPFIINFAVKKILPSFIQKVTAACKDYAEWKRNHSPDYRPWAQL